MNINRQYSLPNCTIILEGYSDRPANSGIDPRPLMSILVNAECYFGTPDKRLSGGKDLFESLVTAVSNYAQELLSGIPHPEDRSHKPIAVKFQKLANQLHRLAVIEFPPESSPNASGQIATQIDLTSVQLFDLVEAVDQFLADSSTLPDMSLKLQPVSRKYADAREPLAKRATPAAIGITSAAAVAIACFYLPVPKVEKPLDPTPNATSSPTPNASPVASGSPTPNPSATPTVPAADLEALLNSVPEINDPTQLRFLQRRVYDQIFADWQANRTTFDEALVYRVGVGKDGAIIGYKPISDLARDQVEKTPLPKLLYKPVGGSVPAQEPIAQFKIVFTERGILQVSPWKGFTKEPSLGQRIRDSATIRSLGRQLYRQIRKDWAGKPTYKDKLIYRVAVNKDGQIADYEALNQPAFDYLKETPLEKISQPTNSALLQEPLAQFQVVFRSSGVLEVGPLP